MLLNYINDNNLALYRHTSNFLIISIHIFWNVRSSRLVTICTMIRKAFWLHLDDKAVQSSPNYGIFTQVFGLFLPWIRRPSPVHNVCVYLASDTAYHSKKKLDLQKYYHDNTKSRILSTYCTTHLFLYYSYSVKSAIMKLIIEKPQKEWRKIAKLTALTF
jgi:hypothetical protein